MKEIQIMDVRIGDTVIDCGIVIGIDVTAEGEITVHYLNWGSDMFTSPKATLTILDFDNRN